jgi:hypothetical protein
MTSLTDEAILPLEIVLDILYKYHGMMHPCIPYVTKHPKFIEMALICNEQLKTHCPPDCTNHVIGWSSSCHLHNGMNQHRILLEKYAPVYLNRWITHKLCMINVGCQGLYTARDTDFFVRRRHSSYLSMCFITEQWNMFSIKTAVRGHEYSSLRKERRTLEQMRRNIECLRSKLELERRQVESSSLSLSLSLSQHEQIMAYTRQIAEYHVKIMALSQDINNAEADVDIYNDIRQLMRDTLERAFIIDDD